MEYAYCWNNDLGWQRYQPQVGRYRYWYTNYGGGREWHPHEPYRQRPVLYRYRWWAVFIAKRAERRWAKNNFNPCEG